jgi:hypothetical protein
MLNDPAVDVIVNTQTTSNVVPASAETMVDILAIPAAWLRAQPCIVVDARGWLSNDAVGRRSSVRLD